MSRGVQLGCVLIHILEGGSRTAGAAQLAEGVQQTCPVAPGGLCWQAQAALPHPDVAMLEKLPAPLGYVSHSCRLAVTLHVWL